VKDLNRALRLGIHCMKVNLKRLPPAQKRPENRAITLALNELKFCGVMLDGFETPFSIAQLI
jgi:hypothetical protein